MVIHTIILALHRKPEMLSNFIDNFATENHLKENI